jgi:hypothetical protein
MAKDGLVACDIVVVVNQLHGEGELLSEVVGAPADRREREEKKVTSFFVVFPAIFDHYHAVMYCNFHLNQHVLLRFLSADSLNDNIDNTAVVW